MRAALALFAAALSLAAPARAATFTTERLTDGRIAIHMRGVIERGDEVKAEAARRAAPDASLFLLDSPGGDEWSSVEIGRLNPLAAEVRTGERCASGCAIIWASASHRYIEPEALVGFHGVSRTVDGREQAEPRATAELAAYYGRLGFSDEAIRLMTMAGPSDMYWINDYDAAHGIAFAPRRTTAGEPISTGMGQQAAPQLAATDPWPTPKRVGTFAVRPDGTMTPNSQGEPPQPQKRAEVKPAPKAKPIPRAVPITPEIHF